MSTTVEDTLVAEHQVTIPEKIERPNVKFNPLYWIKKTDTIEVIIKLNGAEQKHWSYNPNDNYYPSEQSGNGLLFVAKLAIVETHKPAEA